jgi:hypothetical protein
MQHEEEITTTKVPKKRGAPKIPAADKRTARYFLHMTEAEKALYIEFADSQHMNLAEFLRAAAHEYITKLKKAQNNG